MNNAALSHFPISLEQKAYDKFLSEFKYGTKYAGMRLGQAFYAYFDLDKSTNSFIRRQFDKLYQLDGNKAKAVIGKLFVLN